MQRNCTKTLLQIRPQHLWSRICRDIRGQIYQAPAEDVSLSHFRMVWSMGLSIFKMVSGHPPAMIFLEDTPSTLIISSRKRVIFAPSALSNGEKSSASCPPICTAPFLVKSSDKSNRVYKPASSAPIQRGRAPR